jgi:hypothetical protein
MKIGKLKIATGAPDPERLLASTGCTPAAMYALLGVPVIAGTVAGALLACAKGDALPLRHELAAAIAREGVDAIRAEVRKLYAPEGQKSGEEAEA